MSIKSLRTGIAAAMGGAILLAGLLVGASIALADESDTTETTVEEKNADRCRGHLHGLTEELAAELGISLDEIKELLRDGATLEEVATELGIDLDAALESVRERILTELDERVASGDVSEERADDIRQRIEEFELGEFPMGPRGFREFGRGFGDVRGFGGFDFDFDFDFGELREKLESGMSLDEALEDLGVDLEETLEDAQAEVLERIDELVTDGIITQERADQIKEMIEGFELGDGFPFGPHGFKFDFDFEGFEDFDFGEFRDRDGRGFGFFFRGGDDVTEGENASFNV